MQQKKTIEREKEKHAMAPTYTQRNGICDDG